jgi:hypothetical protein
VAEQQYCSRHAAERGVANATGRWVDVAGHEHELEPPRAMVWLSDSENGLWRACLLIWTGNTWKASREFPTWAEAMNHALTIVAAERAQRTTALAVGCRSAQDSERGQQR